jgi:hypothetical protein
VATEVRLLRAIGAELALHAGAREEAYRVVDPGELARSLPGLAEVGGPALVASMGSPARFAKGKRFRSFSGLTPKASETGETDRKGQAMSKAGSSLLRTTLVRAADTARKQDPQLARLYYVQMTERGKNHLGAICVVAANLAERAWAVMERGTPYVICDTDGRPVGADEAKAIIAEHFSVYEEVRVRRRSKKSGGRPPRTSSRDNRSHALEAAAHGATSPLTYPRRSPVDPSRGPALVARNWGLDNASSIGNQVTSKTLRWHMSAARNRSAHGQRAGRCTVKRQAEQVSRPGRLR